MKRLVLALALGAGLGAGLAGHALPARAETDAAPYLAIRSLQALQDKIALGDASAQVSHARLIQRTARLFAGMKPAVWGDARNARALVSYLFSGGSAATMQQAIPRGAIAKDYETLYEGAIAYGLGEDDRARSILLPIDAKTLPTGVAGHLALVQATLNQAVDPAKTLALLDLARLLEPGTLVEEAALRKEIMLLGDGDEAKLLLLIRRYEAGFSRSVYRDNFRQMMTEVSAKVVSANSEIANTRAERLLNLLQKDDRRRIYLLIAKREVLAGHLVASTFAATQAVKLAARGDKDEARANLYLAASTIVGPRYDTAVAELNALSPDRLDERDRNLRSSALGMAAMIRKAAPESTDESTNHPAILSRGEASLASAQALLESAPK